MKAAGVSGWAMCRPPWWPQLWFHLQDLPSPIAQTPMQELGMTQEQQDQAGAGANTTPLPISPGEQINTQCNSSDSCSARGHRGIVL